jgi:hypothetical protein
MSARISGNLHDGACSCGGCSGARRARELCDGAPYDETIDNIDTMLRKTAAAWAREQREKDRADEQ